MAFADQAAELAAHLKAQPLRLDMNLLAQLERYPLIGSLAEWLRQNLIATQAQLQQWVVDAAGLLLQKLAANGGNFLMGAVGSLIHFFMMLFLLFFLLRDGHPLLQRLMRLVPMASLRRAELFRLIGTTTRAVVYGTGFTALIQGVLVGVGFAIAGLPSTVVFGVLAALLAFVPIGGAALVWLPAVIYLAATSLWGWAFFMLIWGIGVSLSDNLLRPLLISSRAPISLPMIVVGIIGGISAFGVIGAIIGPVLLTTVAALLRFLDETRAHDLP